MKHEKNIYITGHITKNKKNTCIKRTFFSPNPNESINPQCRDHLQSPPDLVRGKQNTTPHFPRQTSLILGFTFPPPFLTNFFLPVSGKYFVKKKRHGTKSFLLHLITLHGSPAPKEHHKICADAAGTRSSTSLHTSQIIHQSYCCLKKTRRGEKKRKKKDLDDPPQSTDGEYLTFWVKYSYFIQIIYLISYMQ